MSKSETREKIQLFRTIIQHMKAALITQEQRSSIQRLADAMAVFEKALTINEETFIGICGVMVEVDPHIKEYDGFKVGDELQPITKKVSLVLPNAKKHVVVGFSWHFDMHTENNSMNAVIQLDGDRVVEVRAATMNKLYKLAKKVAKKGDELKLINYRLTKFPEVFLSQIDGMLTEVNEVLKNIQQEEQPRLPYERGGHSFDWGVENWVDKLYKDARKDRILYGAPDR